MFQNDTLLTVLVMCVACALPVEAVSEQGATRSSSRGDSDHREDAVLAYPSYAPGSVIAETTARCFQQGVDDYAGTFDTELNEATPDEVRGDWERVTIDHHPGEQQGLVRFENLFGEELHQVPYVAGIVSAHLTVRVSNPGDCGTNLHRMLMPWSEVDTWNSLVGGVQADDVEAASTIDGTLGHSVADGAVITIELGVDTLQTWQSGAASNYGWVMLWQNEQQDGWRFDSSEASVMLNRPKLCIEYTALDCNNNGVVEDGEECDDGNTESGDGCSSECILEGACCLTGGVCDVMTEELCDAQEPAGSYRGDGSVCTGLMSCCLPDGSCVELDPLCCEDLGGLSSPYGEAVCLDDNNGSGVDDACEPQRSELCVAPTEWNVTHPAGIVNYAVSNIGDEPMAWQAEAIEGDWLTISSGSSGTDSGFVTVAYDANPEPASRTGHIRVSTTSAEPQQVDLTLRQATAAAPAASHLAFSSIATQTEHVPFQITIAAETEDGYIDTEFYGRVDLATNPPATVSPYYVTASAGMWTGNVTVDAPYPKTRLLAWSPPLDGISEEFAVASAGTELGRLGGFVTDSMGGRVDGATVTLYSSDGIPLESVDTPMACYGTIVFRGWYCFLDVPIGPYGIGAQKGLQSSPIVDVDVRTGDNVLELKLGDAEDLPVLLVPGILGSTAKWGVHLYPYLEGGPGSPEPSDLKLADIPIVESIWGPLRYRLADVFSAMDTPWDWRARINQGTVLKYLMNAIDDAKEYGECDKVNVVAHSLGGLLVREYIQSDYYRDDIRSFAMVGTPNLGAAISYYLKLTDSTRPVVFRGGE